MSVLDIRSRCYLLASAGMFVALAASCASSPRGAVTQQTGSETSLSARDTETASRLSEVRLYYDAGAFDDARRELEAIQQAGLSAGLQREVAEWWRRFAENDLYGHRFDLANRAFERWMLLTGRSGVDDLETLDDLTLFASIKDRRGDDVVAVAALETLLVRSEAAEDGDLIAFAHTSLGLRDAFARDLETAAARFDVVIANYRERDDPIGLADALCNRVAVASFAGDTGLVRTLAAEAMEIYAANGMGERARNVAALADLPAP